MRISFCHLAIALPALLASLPADAQSRRGPQRADNYAVAESRFGNGTVSGAVRQGRTGLEVQLPGGTWIACRRSCSETLRVESVDFWENRGQQNRIDNECGILGCLSRGIRF